MSDRTFKLSSLGKVYFPASDSAPAITKGELIAYYERVAPVMLRHLAGRPITLHRFPDGLGGNAFFQKSAPSYAPDWIPRVTVGKSDGTVTHLLCDSAAALVWMANQACLTPHVWLSRADRPVHPDRLVVDLDPSATGPLDVPEVRWAARTVRDALTELGLPSFAMTTGSKGFHVVVPLDRSEPYDEVFPVAEALAVKLAEQHPKRLTVEWRKAKRAGRILVDVRRNAYAQTAVAAYAVRAKAGAPVATPIEWDELDAVEPQSYDITTLFDRLDGRPDPWLDIDASPVDLRAAREQLRNG